jgi:hypothetical protein
VDADSAKSRRLFRGMAKSDKLELSDIDAMSAASMSCRGADQQQSQLKVRKVNERRRRARWRCVVVAATAALSELGKEMFLTRWLRDKLHEGGRELIARQGGGHACCTWCCMRGLAALNC